MTRKSNLYVNVNLHCMNSSLKNFKEFRLGFEFYVPTCHVLHDEHDEHFDGR